MLYGASKRKLKNLNEEDRKQLIYLAYDVRSLYNATLRVIAQKVKAYGGYTPCYATLEKEVRVTKEYEALGRPFSHAISQALDNAHHTITHKKLPKAKRQTMSIVLHNPEIRNGMVKVPATRRTNEIWLPLADFVSDKEVFQVVLHPIKGGKLWETIARYRIQEGKKVPSGECLGIDIGINNFATLACSNGATLIIDGKRLKSILFRDYRKRRSGNYTPEDCLRHSNRINDYVCKAALVVLDFCRINRVSKVLIGRGDTTSIERRYMRLPKLWPDFPIAQFQKRVVAVCQRAGIDAKVVDENFTSKASFLDNDPIPYKFSRGPHQFSGTRRYRGLYVSKITQAKINADINGAFNILRLHNACSLAHLQKNPKLIQTPKRVDPLNYKPNH